MRSPRAELLRRAIGAASCGPTASEWGQWTSMAREERVIPLLHRAAMAEDGLGDEHREEAERMMLDVAASAVQLEHNLVEVARRLDDASIEFAVLKGAATAHLDYDDPVDRQFGDIDVLVSPARLLDAVQVLGETGWRQAYTLPGRHERYTHAITLKRTTHVELDLHQRIAHRALGLRIPTDGLLARRVPYEIAGQRLWALHDHDRLIHAAVHTIGSRGQYRRLSGWADVLLLARSNEPEANEVVARADQWRVRSLLDAALRQAHDLAGLPLATPWAKALSARRPTDRLIDVAYMSERRRPALEELAHLRLLSWSDRASYVSGFFHVGDEYAQQRGRSGVIQQVKYLWSRLGSKG